MNDVGGCTITTIGLILGIIDFFPLPNALLQIEHMIVVIRYHMGVRYRWEMDGWRLARRLICRHHQFLLCLTLLLTPLLGALITIHSITLVAAHKLNHVKISVLSSVSTCHGV